jgi:hypothetical protein
MTSLDRDILLQTLRGYAEVNRITEAERRASLRKISDAEARAVYEDLTQGIVVPTEAEKRRLESIRLAYHHVIRKAFEKMSRKLGHEPSF